MTILEELAAHARERVKEEKSIRSAEQLKQMAYDLPKGDFAFENSPPGDFCGGFPPLLFYHV